MPNICFRASSSSIRDRSNKGQKSPASQSSISLFTSAQLSSSHRPPFPPPCRADDAERFLRKETMMMRRICLLSLVLLVQQASGYQPTSRRDLFKVGTAAAFTLASQPANAVLSNKYCASGVGEGCADLSEGNDLIKTLQEKSAANREKNMQVRKGLCE